MTLHKSPMVNEQNWLLNFFCHGATKKGYLGAKKGHLLAPSLACTLQF